MKLQWISEALMMLNPNDPVISEDVVSILENMEADVLSHEKNSNRPNLFKSIRDQIHQVLHKCSLAAYTLVNINQK